MASIYKPKTRKPGDPPPKRGRPRKPEPDPGNPPKLSRLEEEEARRQRAEERATLKRLEAEQRIEAEKARILSGKPIPSNLPGPKDYDWKAIFIEIFRLTKSQREALKAAGVSYTTLRDRRRDDPVFASTLADIKEEILEERIAKAEEVKDGLFEAAVGVGTPGPFGNIDSARVKAAGMYLEAYDPERFAVRPKVEVGVALALPGSVLQAISVAAGKMGFEALPEADAHVVESGTW